MSSKVKAVFCDIDGTLLGPGKKISKGVIDSVKKLDIPFILISGRLPDGVRPSNKILGVEDTFVSFGGGIVVKDGEMIYKNGLDKATALSVEEFAEGSGCAMNFYIDGVWYVTDKDHPMQVEEIKTIGLDPGLSSVSKAKETDIINKIMFCGYPEEILVLEEKLKKEFTGLKIVRSADTLLEVMPESNSKAYGLKLICESLGIGLNEAAAIGDNFNDLDMLQAVGYPFIMGNAPQELKDYGYEVVASNLEDGVSEALEKIEEEPL